MNAHHLRSLLGRRNLAAASVTLLSLAVMGFGFAAHTARAPRGGQDAPDASERAFAVEIPERLPIKVKLKSEKSFKNAENDNWMRELEVEVKNTGSKPIYYVQLSLHMPDVLIGGHPLAASMGYGRTALFYPETPVEPGDVPIMPGESVVLKVNGQNLKGHEYSRDVLKEVRNPKRVVCWVSVIKFGDGTGLWGPDGKLPPPKRNSSNVPKQKNGAEGCRSSPALSATYGPSGLFKVSDSWQPASLLRAYLFLPDEWLASAPPPRWTTAAARASPGVCGEPWGLETALLAQGLPGLPSFSPGGVVTAGSVCPI
jgi:hypothetical protein